MSSAWSEEPESFSWDVMLPERGTAGRGGRKPLATLVVSMDGQTEYRPLPLAVARLLARGKKAKEIDPTTPEELGVAVRQAEHTAAHERVAQLVARRDYATGEVRDKLASDGFATEVVDEALAWAIDAKILSDARFADTFVRSKVGAGWGMARIERELARRGIEAASLEGWPYDYLNPDDELERAVEVAARKTVREPHAREKLARFLVGRGFSSGVALAAAREVLE